MTEWPYDRIDSGEEHVLVSRDGTSGFPLSSFEPQTWGPSAKPVSGSGRGSAWFLETEGGEQWVLRHYRRGGLPGKLFKGTYLYTGEGAVRSFNEFKLLSTLHAQALPVPRPIAARYHRTGLGYRAAIIVERLPDTLSLLELTEPNHHPLWTAAGRCIRRFHDAGVYHADLNATNVLIHPEREQVYLIDFDRGEQRPDTSVSASWKRSNLQRLERGVKKHWPGPAETAQPFLDALMRGYH